RATQHFLKGGKLEADQYIQGKQDEAKRLLRLYGLSDTVQDALWRHLDVPYFLRHDAQEIAWHTRLLHHRESADKPLAKAPPLPQPVQGRVSRRVKHFPIAPEVRIVPDEKGQYHSLSITAGDRPGLLYAIALVLSRYGVSLHTAKIATLGERAEDVFVVSGAA